MLRLVIPATELFDEETNEFSSTKEQILQLEHSLVSLSKWESKWCKPFLSKDIKTFEESVDYIRCMTITQNVNPIVYSMITHEMIRTVNDYIEAPMTATVITQQKGGGGRETVTAEIIYYWMITMNIPFECQKWHLNRLLMLVNVCNIKNQPAKKMSNKELASRNKSINEARKKALQTEG